MLDLYAGICGKPCFGPSDSKICYPIAKFNYICEKTIFNVIWRKSLDPPVVSNIIKLMLHHAPSTAQLSFAALFALCRCPSPQSEQESAKNSVLHQFPLGHLFSSFFDNTNVVLILKSVNVSNIHPSNGHVLIEMPVGMMLRNKLPSRTLVDHRVVAQLLVQSQKGESVSGNVSGLKLWEIPWIAGQTVEPTYHGPGSQWCQFNFFFRVLMEQVCHTNVQKCQKHLAIPGLACQCWKTICDV